MNYNYHTHTIRCNHASGTPEEYILRAIENGVKRMGFSDHFPYVCRDGFEARYRVPTAQVGDYFRELRALREKYKDKIEIKIGFEIEYYPDLFDDMVKKAAEYGAEYLILGQHFLSEEHPGGVYAMKANDSEEHLRIYTDEVVLAIKTGVISYVAHPDVFFFTGDVNVYKAEARRIAEASKEYNVPLEINFLGIRGNRNYPNDDFWSVAGEVGCPVTFGFDSHDTMNAYDGASLSTAEALVEKFGLNYIGEPRLIPLK